jgi:hypothetical protein
LTIIEASSVRIQTMVDGTLRITCDVEPRHARDAFNLFGSPGTPMALAALRTAPAAIEPPQATPTPEKPKGGAWSQWCAIRCGEQAFQDWLFERYTKTWDALQGRETETAEVAAEVIRSIVGIASRAELDNDPAAFERFSKLIRGPWQKHYQGIAA